MGVAKSNELAARVADGEGENKDTDGASVGETEENDEIGGKSEEESKEGVGDGGVISDVSNTEVEKVKGEVDTDDVAVGEARDCEETISPELPCCVVVSDVVAVVDTVVVCGVVECDRGVVAFTFTPLVDASVLGVMVALPRGVSDVPVLVEVVVLARVVSVVSVGTSMVMSRERVVVVAVALVVAVSVCEVAVVVTETLLVTGPCVVAPSVVTVAAVLAVDTLVPWLTVLPVVGIGGALVLTMVPAGVTMVEDSPLPTVTVVDE